MHSSVSHSPRKRANSNGMRGTAKLRFSSINDILSKWHQLNSEVSLLHAGETTFQFFIKNFESFFLDMSEQFFIKFPIIIFLIVILHTLQKLLQLINA